MCFTNNLEQLKRFRNRKTPLTLEKVAEVDPATGYAFTQYMGQHDRVWWKKGTIAKPTRVLGPRKNSQVCTAGLYFNKNGPTRTVHSDRTVVRARIQPQDIIGVDFDGKKICVVAAKVLHAPTPDERESRIKFLEPAIERAERSIQRKKESIERLEADLKRESQRYEEFEEAYEQMCTEVAELHRTRRTQENAEK